MKNIAFTLLGILLCLSFHSQAQTEEQYKKWQTPDLLSIRQYMDATLAGQNDNRVAYLDHSLKKLEKALETDGNNPLLLSLAGFVLSEKAHTMFYERAYDTYSSEMVTEGGENIVLNKRRAEAYQLSRKAESYYLKATEQNESSSMVELAKYYRSGFIYESINPKKHIILYAVVKAIPWLKKAEAMRDQEAALILGELYVKGEGVQQDIKAGEKLISAAADDPASVYYELGVRYVDGYGNPDNLYKAHMKMSEVRPYEFVYDAKLGLYFLEKAANEGNIPAAFFLALSYGGMHTDHDDREWRNKIVAPDPAKAFRYMKLAAINENETIYPWYYLAMFYLNGTGTTKNIKLGLEMLEKIANGNNDWDKAALRETIRKERAKMK